MKFLMHRMFSPVVNFSFRWVEKLCLFTFTKKGEIKKGKQCIACIFLEINVLWTQIHLPLLVWLTFSSLSLCHFSDGGSGVYILLIGNWVFLFVIFRKWSWSCKWIKQNLSMQNAGQLSVLVQCANTKWDGSLPSSMLEE